jgi:hypothetical protein
VGIGPEFSAEKGRWIWTSPLLGSRWLRVVGGVIALALLGSTIWFALVIEPQLTATRFTAELSIPDRPKVAVSIDPETETTAISGGVGRLSDAVLVRDSLFVIGAEWGADRGDPRWVEVPIDRLESDFAALRPARASAALRRDVNRCAPFSDDARIILALLGEAGKEQRERYELCGTGVGAPARKSGSVLIDIRRIRPNRVLRVDPALVDTVSATELAVIIQELNAFMAAQSP